MADLPEDMVERAAIALSLRLNGYWDFNGEDVREPYREHARAALAAALKGCVHERWAIRVDTPHPRRSERLGDLMTHLGEEKSRRCREVWAGWTPVRRTVVHFATEWVEPITEPTSPVDMLEVDRGE